MRPVRLARLPAHNEYYTNHFRRFSLCDRVHRVQRPGVVSEVGVIVEAVEVFLNCLAERFRYVEVREWGF